MKIEIERKFLVLNEGWRAETVGVERLRDGLLGESDSGKIRVRLADSYATLAVKSDYSGLARREFEYHIPRLDAEFMLATLCGDFTVEKLRHRVIHAGCEWSVDVYEKKLASIVIAEIELEREDQKFPVPPWLGREVSGDPRFHKRAMIRRAQASSVVLTIDDLGGLPDFADPEPSSNRERRSF